MFASNTNHRIQRLERLTEMSRGIGKMVDLETLLYSMTELACDLTRSAMCCVVLYEPETDLLKYIAGPVGQRDNFLNIRIPLDNTIEGSVYRDAKPIIIDNCPADNRFDWRTVKQLSPELRNIIVVPLLFRGETIGVFEGINKIDQEQFSFEDLTILEILSSQAATAILSNLLFDEVRQAYQEVDELEKMKSNFIAITSHELRTPIGLILGHATFLNDFSTDPQIQTQLEVIIRNAERLKSILEDLTKVNEIQLGTSNVRHKLISINQIIYRCAEHKMPSARAKDISFLIKLPEKDLFVDADEEKIALVINNLVDNAIVFSNKGCHIQLTAEQIGNYVQVSIADNGIGIPAKDLPHIFDRFFQVQSHLTRKHGGLGLGLSVAKSMVELHKGQIWAESIEGKGSRFSFILPRTNISRSEGSTAPFTT